MAHFNCEGISKRAVRAMNVAIDEKEDESLIS